MSVSFEIDDQRAFVRFDAIGPGVHRMLLEELRPIAAELEGDARAIAVAHFHSVGKKPGLYLESIHAGVSEKGNSVVGWLRSGSPIAHLLEEGFTISDMVIESSSPMAFEMDGVEAFATSVHRHATAVQPYPAILPAFEARRGEIEASLHRVAERAGAR